MAAFLNDNFPDTKSDLFAVFIETKLSYAFKSGHLVHDACLDVYLVYEKLRRTITQRSLASLIQLEYSGFADAHLFAPSLLEMNYGNW